MDNRSRLQVALDEYIGEPLYYCDECRLAVKVTVDGDKITIHKPCGHENARVIAPRKATLSGKGYAGLTIHQKAKVRIQQILAGLTGRNV